MNTQVSPPPLPSHVQVATEPSVVARAPELLGKAAWRYRWQLAPVVGYGGVLACGQATPGLTALGLATVAGGAYRVSRSEVRFRGRMWLSAAERRYLSMWAGAGAAWSLVMYADLPPRWAAVTLASAQAYPAWKWGASRLPKRRKLSNATRALVNTWNLMVSIHGPDPVKGSLVIKGSVSEPGPGAASFEVQLRPGMHAHTAVTDAVARGVEALMALPVDTVRLSVDRSSNSTRMRAVISPERHLESQAVKWPGPELNGDGSMPIAETPSGQLISSHLYNDTGIEHGIIAGTSDAGKSTASAVVLLPGPTAGVETVWFLDGKKGTSAPYLRPACDWYARKPLEWIAAIEAAHAVMNARQERRGEAELADWVTLDEEDPILTLFVDEATTVGNAIKQRHHTMVWDMLREGRAVGVRVVQVAQDVMADGIIGGRKARDLMAGNGTMIALRPGGSMAGRLTIDSTNINIDLTALPPEPGFCAIIRKGNVLAKEARIRFADKGAAGRAAQAVQVRPLVGADADAAGALYAKRHDPEAFTAPASSSEPEPTAEEVRESDAVLLAILAEGPKTLKEIGGDDQGAGRDERWTWTRKTASRTLVRMSGEGQVIKDGDKWCRVLDVDPAGQAVSVGDA